MTIPFIKKMIEMMTQAAGIVICGGDWNLRLNPRLDSSNPIKQNSLQKKIRLLMSNYSIMDVWRCINTTSRDYTHYSHSHKVYSRIDYFFVFKTDFHRVQNAEIGNIDLSDHAPIFITLKLNNIQKKYSLETKHLYLK